MSLTIIELRASDPKFEACFRIRLEVFVKEQMVPLEAERDHEDGDALHFLAVEQGVALGTARVVLSDSARSAKIGRVAVLAAARGRGIGTSLIQYIESNVPVSELILDAQVHALPFYERLGFAAVGEEFFETGIPHRRMRKVL